MKRFLFLVLAVWAAVSTTIAVRKSFPFNDKGSAIFVASSEEGQLAIVEIMKNFGREPIYRADSPEIKRCILDDGTIINYPLPEFNERLDNPSAGLAIAVDDPRHAAILVSDFLHRRGFTGEILSHREPGLPDDAITFVSTNALKGTILVFRKHVVDLPKPPKWEE